MSDKTTEKKSLWSRLTGSLAKIDDAIHEKPIRRIEDVFALIGLGTVVDRHQTIFGAILLILGFILRGGVGAWGWSKEQYEQVRTMLDKWTPFDPHGKKDSLVVMAVRRLFDYQHLFRWLVILGGIGLLLSLGIWLIVVAGWIGYLMFLASLVVLTIWSVMSKTIYKLLGVLIFLAIAGFLILTISWLPGSQMWMMVFAILSSIVGMAILGVVFWPISVVARWFASEEDAVTADTETAKDKKKRTSLGSFIAGYVLIMCWPVSLMVSAIMFNVWETLQTQVYYMTVIAILLSLGLFGIRKEGIRKLLNSMAVTNLFIYLIMVGYQWMVPAEFKATVQYQGNDYIWAGIGVLSNRTDATYYWDVNENSRPDTVDLRFMQDGLTDSTVFLKADRRYADVNGDGQSTVEDLQYFKRFMDDRGPAPVKAMWLGTPKPAMLTGASAVPMMQQTQPQLQVQFVNATVPAHEVSEPVIPKQASVNATSPDAMRFFSFSVKGIEVTDKDIRVQVEWLRSHPAPEAASVSSSTYLIDDRKNKLQIVGVDGGLPLNGKYELPLNSPFSATLIFPLPADGQMVKTLSLFHYDLPEWGHLFKVMDMTV